MLSTGTVGMTGCDHEPGAQDRPFHVNGEVRSPPEQVAGQEELHPSMRVALVGFEVLAFRVGVDRHLGGLASADWPHEIEGDHPALLAGQFECCVGDGDLHPGHSRETGHRCAPPHSRCPSCVWRALPTTSNHTT